GIDSKRIGACLFCQEFWMELYALYEIGLVRVEVKTVNINSEAFKRNFLGAQPPIMIEQENAYVVCLGATVPWSDRLRRTTGRSYRSPLA
uniref:Uncharacterized protein n=1 Tax=Plectus sambesii TaxID=2011161 RepID=A0A914VED1_9BILA